MAPAIDENGQPIAAPWRSLGPWPDLPGPIGVPGPCWRSSSPVLVSPRARRAPGPPTPCLALPVQCRGSRVMHRIPRQGLPNLPQRRRPLQPLLRSPSPPRATRARHRRYLGRILARSRARRRAPPPALPLDQQPRSTQRRHLHCRLRRAPHL